MFVYNDWVTSRVSACALQVECAHNGGMTNTQIESAKVHYGFPTVWVTAYATTDRQGNPVIVDKFYRNGGHITAEGYRVRKDGTPYERRQVVDVSTPSEVAAALESMEVTA